MAPRQQRRQMARAAPANGRRATATDAGRASRRGGRGGRRLKRHRSAAAATEPSAVRRSRRLPRRRLTVAEPHRRPLEPSSRRRASNAESATPVRAACARHTKVAARPSVPPPRRRASANSPNGAASSSTSTHSIIAIGALLGVVVLIFVGGFVYDNVVRANEVVAVIGTENVTASQLVERDAAADSCAAGPGEAVWRQRRQLPAIPRQRQARPAGSNP